MSNSSYSWNQGRNDAYSGKLPSNNSSQTYQERQSYNSGYQYQQQQQQNQSGKK